MQLPPVKSQVLFVLCGYKFYYNVAQLSCIALCACIFFSGLAHSVIITCKVNLKGLGKKMEAPLNPILEQVLALCMSVYI